MSLLDLEGGMLLMKKVFSCVQVFALLLIGAVIACGQGNGAGGPNVKSGLDIGKTLTDFSLTDLDGKPHQLSKLKGEKGTLLVFVSVQCPYSNAYNERMEKIAQDYKARGVAFIGVNPNATESPEAVKRHAAESKFSFPVFKDNENKLADLLGANVTPEAFLFDVENKLTYHGRIDNSKNIEQVKSNDLRDALESHLSGKPIEKPTSKPFGCGIKRVK
jgi:peroxiredoxin